MAKRKAITKANSKARTKSNPFDWKGCIDKVSRQPGIYSPGGVCAAAERRKVMGRNPSYGIYWLIQTYPAGPNRRLKESTVAVYKVYSLAEAKEDFENMGWDTAVVREAVFGSGMGKVVKRLSRNGRNPDELETVFSPESVASKLTLATAVPGAAVAMTAIELAHAVDAGLVDETAAVLMRPAEEVAEAVVGNPGDQWTVRTYEHRKPYRQWAIAGYNDAKSGAGFAAYQPEWMWLEKVPKSYKDNAKRWFDKGKQAGIALLRKSESEYYRYWNSVPPGLDRRANPSTDADAMYESFHGQPPTETVEVVEELREHGHLATLGTLVELKLQSMAGKDISIEWTKDNPYLASNEHGTQLYIVGGDQTVDLKALGMAGDKWEREHMVLGVCHEVTYRTRKGFDKFRLVDYYHNLGEETGVQPMLAYDTVNDKLSIVGGQYEVKPEGIVN